MVLVAAVVVVANVVSAAVGAAEVNVYAACRDDDNDDDGDVLPALVATVVWAAVAAPVRKPQYQAGCRQHTPNPQIEG